MLVEQVVAGLVLLPSGRVLGLVRAAVEAEDAQRLRERGVLDGVLDDDAREALGVELVAFSVREASRLVSLHGGTAGDAVHVAVLDVHEVASLDVVGFDAVKPERCAARVWL